MLAAAGHMSGLTLTESTRVAPEFQIKSLYSKQTSLNFIIMSDGSR